MTRELQTCQSHDEEMRINTVAMATPFVPVPVPMSPRATLNRPQRSVEYSRAQQPSATPEPLSVMPTLLGYEVMEERAKFTVYKVLVRKSLDESWVIFRRYTDFCRLNDKLKEMFPGFRLSLPPKRWFKDNYELEFLESRQSGLQTFLQNLVAVKDVCSCVAVREFLCLDDPPGPFDSLEESRAFCETLEESHYRLQRELLDKQREISSLKKTLQEKDQLIQTLQSRVSVSWRGGDSTVEAESSTVEADQADEQQSAQRSVCWCGPVIQVAPLLQ